jgi:hypothetical protein
MDQSSSKVRVCVRSRPLHIKEARGRKCVSIVKDRIIVGDKSFIFDGVYDDKSSQIDVYDGCIAALIDGCFLGFNATILAYGQTGSGKTHTMIGSVLGDEDEEGVIPRAVKHIFNIINEKMEKSDGKLVTNLHVSFIEIYNDECKDLLHLDILPRDIFIREDKDGKIFFTGAREEVVVSIDRALELLDKGNMNRTTAETLMNATSSRSHAIFTISIELYEYSTDVQEGVDVPYTEGSAGGSLIQSKIHLVDLAGSERAKRTGAGGVRLKESVGINQGLLSLGKVIRALTTVYQKNTGGTHATHIPYRESKLTRFLQDSLGGNSRTLMLACISPAEINLHETLSTLQYASRARAVNNKVVANISTGLALESGDDMGGDQNDGLVNMLRAQIRQMQQALITIKKKDLDLNGSFREEKKERGSPDKRGRNLRFLDICICKFIFLMH